MKLQFRLAFPLFVVAVAVTAAVTMGVIVLVRGTINVALKQSGRQLERITENALRTRVESLNEVATVLGLTRGGLRERNAKWKHVPVDTAGIYERRSFRKLDAFGPAIDARDLVGLAAKPPADPPILRTTRGLIIAGTAKEEGTGNMVLAGQALGKDFTAELGKLLQADIEIKVGGKVVSSVRLDANPPDDSYPVSRSFLTPGGAEVVVTMFMPARGVYETRRKALYYSIGGGLILLLLAFLFYFYSVARVTRPIKDLISAAERMGTGDLDARLEAQAPAELGALVREFNKTTRSLKEVQEKLVHSAKLSSVGQLVAGISHELNNPLMGLLGHAENLADDLKGETAARAKIETVIAEARRMRQTLASLRDFTRPSGPERVPTDLNRVAEEVTALVRHDLEKSRVMCEMLPAKEGAVIKVSPDQVRQVILNLVINAMQAMPQGGKLTIRTVAGPGACSVVVEDTGTGIPEDVRDRVLEPFFSTKPGRMGLGLAICREIVSQHGGKLTLDSRPGGGTRVAVEFPADKPS